MDSKNPQTLDDTYRYHGTRTTHREKGKKDYIVVMNQNVKNKHNIEKYAVVQNLFMNKSMDDREWRTLISFGKVVIDDTLDDDEICIDQTIRNAIGMKYDEMGSDRVKIYNLKRNLRQKILGFFRPGQFLYLRVNYPSLNDIEKGICRMSDNSLKIINSNNGNSVWIECCESDYRKNVKRLIDEIYNEYNYMNYVNNKDIIDDYFSDIKLPKELYPDWKYYKEVLGKGNENSELLKMISSVEIMKDADYIKALFELVFTIEFRNYEELLVDSKRLMNNIFAYGEWEYKCVYELVDIKINAYGYYSEAENNIHTFQKENIDVVKSMEAKYPDSDVIFNMSPDLETIRLDKYYRDKLGLNILDSVKVKRRLIESLRDDVIEYGLVFILTIFAAIAAVTPENLVLLKYATPIALVFTALIMYVRNK